MMMYFLPDYMNFEGLGMQWGSSAVYIMVQLANLLGGDPCKPQLSLSSSVPNSEPTQVTMLYSRQGTTETIEEVEGEHEEEGAPSASRPEEEEVEDYSLGSEGAAYTPDTDVPLYSAVDSNAEAPPSYSKAVSFENLPFGSPDDSAGKSLMMVSPDDSRTDKLNDTILPPLTHELTASELLLNK